MNLTLIGLLVCFGLLALVYYSGRAKSSPSRSLPGFSPNLPVLSRYSRDLTRLAFEKKIDPVIGRQEEIALVIQILSRRNKNNPVLVGQAGVGKTAIAEGLAIAINNKAVPTSLYGKRVLALDLPGILAGTKYRGEFEERLKKITIEIVAAKRSIILFIDEIHILAQAGDAEGAINAADILKPMLARGDLQVVGATTPEEYNEFIKKDKTLDRRLHPVYVKEPDAKQTKAILEGVKSTYENYHQVKITSAALVAAIKETKSIIDRSYPDKAIDAIDEACSKAHIDVIAKKRPASADLLVDAADVRQVVMDWKRNS